MNKEEKITISVNEEDVQNIINAYEKDIEYIKQLEKENKQLKEIIDKAIEYIEKGSYKDLYNIKSIDYLLEILKEVE